MRVELVQRDGEQHLVQYDGKKITIFNPLQNITMMAVIEMIAKWRLSQLALRHWGRWAAMQQVSPQPSKTRRLQFI